MAAHPEQGMQRESLQSENARSYHGHKNSSAIAIRVVDSLPQVKLATLVGVLTVFASHGGLLLARSECCCTRWCSVLVQPCQQ